jgi:hypothetical protein
MVRYGRAPRTGRESFAARERPPPGTPGRSGPLAASGDLRAEVPEEGPWALPPHRGLVMLEDDARRSRDMGRRQKRWTAWWARPVIDGKVRCEVRGGQADVSDCEGCTWMSELDLLSEQPRVFCRPDAALAAARGSGI